MAPTACRYLPHGPNSFHASIAEMQGPGEVAAADPPPPVHLAGGRAQAASPSPAPAAIRRLPLPSNPSNTKLQHQQQLRQQAQQGLVGSDMEALQLALGGSSLAGASLADQLLLQAPDGSLSALTVQLLLQPQVSSSWVGRLVQAARLPGAEPGAGAAPPALSSSKAQANASQAAAAGPLSAAGPLAVAPCRSSRYPPGRREVFILSKWLEVGPEGGWAEGR